MNNGFITDQQKKSKYIKSERIIKIKKVKRAIKILSNIVSHLKKKIYIKKTPNIVI